MPVVFLALVAASLALWAAGEPARIVFAVAVPAWAVFALMLGPPLRRYRAAMGLAEREAVGLRARLAGLRVVLVAALTSALPFAAAAAQWLGGQDLGLFMSPRSAGRLGFLLGAATFVLPFLASWLHLDALRDAAETEPVAPVPLNPIKGAP